MGLRKLRAQGLSRAALVTALQKAPARFRV